MCTLDRPPLLIAALLLPLLAAAPASAQVYRCQQGDTTVFSDKPCAPGARTVEVPPAIVIPSGPRVDLIEEGRKREQRESQASSAQRKAEEEWQAQHAQSRAAEERIHRGRAEGKVVEGMSPADVRRIHGEPTVVSRNQRGEANRETWGYLLDRTRMTVVFTDDKVSSVSTRELRK